DITTPEDGLSSHIDLATIQQGSLLKHLIGACVEGVVVDGHAGIIVRRLPAASRFVKNRCGCGTSIRLRQGVGSLYSGRRLRRICRGTGRDRGICIRPGWRNQDGFTCWGRGEW